MVIRLAISDDCWAQIRSAVDVVTRRGPKGEDKRLFLEAVIWILRTGAPWRDLPSIFGKWGTVYRRYRRWALAGSWERLRCSLPHETAELLLIDSTIVKAHPHAAGALRRGAVKRPRGLGDRAAVSRRKFMPSAPSAGSSFDISSHLAR